VKIKIEKIAGSRNSRHTRRNGQPGKKLASAFWYFYFQGPVL